MDAECVPWRFLVNLATVIVFIVVFIVLEVYPIVPAYHRGFYCNDNTINKPYFENETISTSCLIGVTVVLIVVVVVICELLKKCLKTSDEINKKKFVLVGTVKIPAWICRILSRVCLIIVGLFMTLIVVDIAKKMLGRLRPHFLTVCKPDYSKFNCSDGYIIADVCTNINVESLAEARLSFPSGHGATAGFVSVVTALYIEYAVQLRPSSLLKPLIQYVLICIGLACAFTRISDYYHHWSDILVGLIVGAGHAVYTIYYLIRLHKEEKARENHTVVPSSVEMI